MIMSQPGAVAPVVYGGKVRAVMAYLDRDKLQARHLSPLDVMNAARRLQRLPADRRRQVRHDRLRHRPQLDVRRGRATWATSRSRDEHGNAAFLRDVATPKDASFIQTNVVRVNGRRQVYIPVFRQLGSSTLDVVNTLKERARDDEGTS